MYTNIIPSPPAGVGLNRADGVKPSVKEVNEQTARGDFSQALSTQRAPALQFEDARAARELAQNQSQQAATATPFSASQLLNLISKNLQRSEQKVEFESEDQPVPVASPSNSKKEKQAKQFEEVANFSSKQSLFEFVV